MRPVLLIDSFAQIYRGFFAVRALSTRNGTPTNAVFAMAKFLLKLHTEFPGESHDGAFVFDLGRPTHRINLAPDYKANRPPTPPELKSQFPDIRELIDAFGWPIFEQEAWEADDLIAALSQAFPDRPFLIVSADKDLSQLIDDRVAMLVPSHTGAGFEHRGTAAVQAKFGVPPAAIVDYLALVGDAADNIPGIDGVGAKTAAKLMSQFGSIDAMLANPSAITSASLRQKIIDGADRLHRNIQLVSLLRDPPPGANWQNDMFERRSPDFPRIRALAERLELFSIVRDVDKAAPEFSPDDLFAPKPPPPAVPAQPAVKSAESDQLEFKF